MNNTLISIIIPVYNVEKYLGECLESVINQTYHNIEIICVYDPSSDNSLSILEKYSAYDNRIQIIKNEERGGLSYARNLGFTYAKGKYIYYLDSDDKIELNAMENLYNYAEEYEIECIYFDSRLLIEIGSIGKFERRYKLKDINKQVIDGPSLFKLMKKNKVYDNTVWRRFWRKDFLIKNNLKFSNELWASEDVVFSLKAILYGRRVMVVDECYHVYRKHEGSATTEVSPLRMICSFKAYCMLLDFWRNYQCQENIKEIINGHLKELLIISKQFYSITKHEVCKNKFKDGIEQHLFEVLIEQEYERTLGYINTSVLQRIREFKNVIVYGAFLYAAEVVEKLERNKIKIDSLAVTYINKKTSGINGIPIHEIKDLCYMKETAIVVLGIQKRNREDVIQTLNNYGFKYYITLD